LLPLVAGMTQRGDELPYLRGAYSIAESGVPDYGVTVWDVAHWAPLYPYSLGGLYALVGPSSLLLTTRVLQVLVSTLTAFLVFRIARRAFGERCALWSTALVAFFPTSIAYTQYLLCETVFTALLVGVVAILVPPGAELRPGRALVAGLVGGLCALTRSVFLYQSLFVVAAILLAVRGAWSWRARVAGAFLAGLVLVIAPWSISNTLRFERFLLIDTNGGNVLHKNWNAVRQENHDIGLNERFKLDRARSKEDGLRYRPRIKGGHFIDDYNAEVRAGTRFVLAHPGLFVRHTAVRAAELVNPTSFLVRGLRKRDYGDVPRVLEELLVALTLATTMGILGLGVVGLVVPAIRPRRLYVAALVLATAAACVLVLSQSRYRFPLMPLLVPFAVDAALRLRSGERLGDRWRWIVAGVLLAAMAWAWVVYLPLSYGVE